MQFGHLFTQQHRFQGLIMYTSEKEFRCYCLCANYKNTNLWKRWHHAHACYMFSL